MANEPLSEWPTQRNQDPWPLKARCQGCHKPILVPGHCYTCATGQPRTLFRPDEQVSRPAA